MVLRIEILILPPILSVSADDLILGVPVVERVLGHLLFAREHVDVERSTGDAPPPPDPPETKGIRRNARAGKGLRNSRRLRPCTRSPAPSRCSCWLRKKVSIASKPMSTSSTSNLEQQVRERFGYLLGVATSRQQLDTYRVIR